jgi:hypothetical protein
MESTGIPGCLHISEETHKLLSQEQGCLWACRGELEVKGKGAMTTYLLRPVLSDAENHLRHDLAAAP